MMNNTPPYDKISLLRLAFKGLQDKELEEMAGLTEMRTYPPSHVLCQEGAYEDVFYIVAEGNVIITKKIGDEEAERVLRIGGKGDLVGEMALIQNAPRAATVRTTSECTVLEMEKRDFETILSRSPGMAIDIIRITLDRIRANDQMAISELQKNNKVLRLMDRNKLEFIQVAAHELRTPLTIIKGYVNLLRSLPEFKSNPALGDTVDGIVKGADRMHEVVNMMLDVTRIDAETLKVASVPVLLKRVLQGLAQNLGKAAAERGIGISLEYAEETPIIHADPGLVEKALYQLVVNAVKYTPDGGKVTLRARPVTMDDNIPGAEIAIQDTGIGLDPEHHELIFEKFYQVGSVALHSTGKTSFKGGGPGLGLSLVRGVARAHGGKVWVESAGHDEINYPGCTFYLQLPVKAPGRHAPAPTAQG
jgi:signal transduction histidine kinase